VSGNEQQRLLALGGQQLPGDLRRGLQPLLAAASLPVEPGVLDGHPQCGGQCGDEFLILLAEAPVRAPAQIQVAEHYVADPHRHAEEAVHRRMTLREAHRAGVIGHPVQPDRSRILDQGPEQTATLGEVPDARYDVVGHTHVDELLEPPSVSITPSAP